MRQHIASHAKTLVRETLANCREILGIAVYVIPLWSLSNE
jgi:hypothetical protein